MRRIERTGYTKAPSHKHLWKYLHALLTGLSTDTSYPDGGTVSGVPNYGDEAMREQLDSIEADPKRFIDWARGTGVRWLYDNQGDLVGLTQTDFGTPNRLLPADLNLGHCGWSIHPNYRLRGHGATAVSICLDGAHDRGFSFVTLTPSSASAKTFIEHVIPEAAREHVVINDVSTILVNVKDRGY